MEECLICGKKEGPMYGMSGTILCQEHTAAAKDWATTQQAAGHSVDVGRWALRERSALREQVHLRFSPETVKRLDRIAEVRRLSRAGAVEQMIRATPVSQGPGGAEVEHVP